MDYRHTLYQYLSVFSLGVRPIELWPARYHAVPVGLHRHKGRERHTEKREILRKDMSCVVIPSTPRSCMMQADSEKLRQAWIKAVQDSIATAFRENGEEPVVSVET